MIRRSRTSGELAYYRCHSTEPVPLTVLVKTAARGGVCKNPPLPATSRIPDMKIAIYSWSTTLGALNVLRAGLARRDANPA